MTTETDSAAKSAPSEPKLVSQSAHSAKLDGKTRPSRVGNVNWGRNINNIIAVGAEEMKMLPLKIIQEFRRSFFTRTFSTNTTRLQWIKEPG